VTGRGGERCEISEGSIGPSFEEGLASPLKVGAPGRKAGGGEQEKGWEERVAREEVEV